jgi:hypothetical protein
VLRKGAFYPWRTCTYRDTRAASALPRFLAYVLVPASTGEYHVAVKAAGDPGVRPVELRGSQSLRHWPYRLVPHSLTDLFEGHFRRFQPPSVEVRSELKEYTRALPDVIAGGALRVLTLRRLDAETALCSLTLDGRMGLGVERRQGDGMTRLFLLVPTTTLTEHVERSSPAQMLRTEDQVLDALLVTPQVFDATHRRIAAAYGQ